MTAASNAKTLRFAPYPFYQESDIRWLRKAPEHWSLRRLRSTVESCQNGAWGDEPDGEQGIVCVRVADFDRAAFTVRLDNPTLRSIDARLALSRGLNRGDLLLEKSGGGELQPVGAVVLYDHQEPAVCSNFVARMPVAPDHDPRYLSYLHAALYSLRVNTRHIKQSTGIQNLDSASYLAETAAIPPYAEQRAIATFLDRETAKIDALIAKKERLVELLQEKRTALITQAVTKGLDPSVPMKDSGVEWLREIPAHWTVRRLQSLTRQDVPIVYGILLPGPRLTDGVPYIGAGDVTPDKLDLALLPRTTPEIAAMYPRTCMRAGELVYAIRGSFGNTEVVPAALEGVNLSRDAARIAPAPLVSSQWLCWALKSDSSQAYFRHYVTGTAVTGVNIRDLKRLPVPLPPEREQLRIAESLRTGTGRLDGLGRKIDRGIKALREYRTALISAAVTGQIDVRGQVA